MTDACAPDAARWAGPSADDIRAAAAALAGRIVHTPVLKLSSDRITPALPDQAAVWMKLELFQQAGSFKARGALLSVDALDPAARRRGVVAVSAGNHALAVAWAAKSASVSAKVVMPKNVDPARVAGCEALGADVVLVETIADAMATAEALGAEEGRAFIHPFDAPLMITGAATVGYEFAEQSPALDVLVTPVGGGGLISGMARAFSLLAPACRVIGVEPEGADAMRRSFESGAPERLERVDTIADSLGAPMTLPLSLHVARTHVDEIVRVSDDQMRSACALLYDGLKIAAEPACAASLAAVAGPLRDRLRGLRVGVIACGSNISLGGLARHLDGVQP